MRALILSALLLLANVAQADAKDDAIGAALQDCVTTGAALSFGFSEVTPLGPVAACALKPVMLAMVQDEPEPERTRALHSMRAVWGGAAVNNVMALIGAGAAAPVFGVMIALGLWAAGEEEREFTEQCAIHEHYAGRKLECIFRG